MQKKFFIGRAGKMEFRRAYDDRFYKKNKLGQDIYFGRRKYPTMLVEDRAYVHDQLPLRFKYKDNKRNSITVGEWAVNRRDVLRRKPWLREKGFEAWYNNEKYSKNNQGKRRWNLVGGIDFTKAHNGWRYRQKHNYNKGIMKKIIHRNHQTAKARRQLMRNWRARGAKGVPPKYSGARFF